MCERACVHKVPPCKCLIVCVGNNSPIPQGMKQARKRPGPQTSGGPPGHGTPRRTTAGTTAASTQKGQRRARRRDLRQPQCRFGRFFEGKKVSKGVCNVAKLATLCISISPTTGWATGQTENMRCVNRTLKKISAVKINLR